MFPLADLIQPSRLRRVGLAVLACSAAFVLGGCGGGNRAKDYVPDRIVVFGDENSAFAPAEGGISDASGYRIQGLVYTVNSIYTVNTAYCENGAAGAPCRQGVSGYLNTTSSQNPNLVAVSNFFVTDPAFPQGQAYRFDLQDADLNSLYLVGVGTGTKTDALGTVTTNDPMSRMLEVVYDCSASETWMQALAHYFSKGYKDPSSNAVGCPHDGAGGAATYAVPDAKVADLQTQFNNNRGALGPGVLVAVMMGQNDIIEIYESSTWATLAAKRAQAKYRADRMAGVIKQMLDTGAKVVVVGVPDLGVSPYGRSLTTSSTSACPRNYDNAPNCNGDLQQMVDDFNNTLIVGDKDAGLAGLRDYASQGRKLAFADTVTLLDGYVGSTSYVNAAVCEKGTGTDPATNLPRAAMFKPSGAVLSNTELNNPDSVRYCTNLSLVNGGNLSTYIWADDRHLSWPVQQAIGLSVYNHATTQF